MTSASHLLRFAAATVLSVAAVQARPEFVGQSLEPAGVAQVVSVAEGTHLDMVLLEGGWDAGFRTGMIAAVDRAGAFVARVVIAEASATHSVALILDLAPDQSIQPDDRVLRSIIRIS